MKKENNKKSIPMCNKAPSESGLACRVRKLQPEGEGRTCRILSGAKPKVAVSQ